MSSTPKRNQKLKNTIYQSFLLTAIMVGYSGTFIACGPSNKMKTLKQGSGVIEFTDEEKRVISDAQARAEEEAGRTILEEPTATAEDTTAKEDGLFKDGHEDGEKKTEEEKVVDTAAADKTEAESTTAADATTGTAETTVSDAQAEATQVAEADKTEVKANMDSQALMDMITDISLSDDNSKLKISYKSTGGKRQTTTLVQDKAVSDTTYVFKNGFFNKNLDTESKISATVSSIQSLSTLIVAIVAKPKSTSDGIPAIAIIKTQQIKLKNSALDTANNSDDFLSALKSTNLIAKRMLFAAEKSTDNQGTVEFALLDSAFNKIIITGKNAEGKKVLTLKSNFPRSRDKLTNISMVYPTTASLDNSVLQSNGNEFLKFKREIKDKQLQLSISVNPSERVTSNEANLHLLTIESLKLTVKRKSNDILTSDIVSAKSTTSVDLEFVSTEEEKKNEEPAEATKAEEATPAADTTATSQATAIDSEAESKIKENPAVKAKPIVGSKAKAATSPTLATDNSIITTLKDLWTEEKGASTAPSAPLAPSNKDRPY